MTAEFDMGDEGKLPPRLTNVGANASTEAIEQIVFEGEAARPPGARDAHAEVQPRSSARLAAAFEQADLPQRRCRRRRTPRKRPMTAASWWARTASAA